MGQKDTFLADLTALRKDYRIDQRVGDWKRSFQKYLQREVIVLINHLKLLDDVEKGKLQTTWKKVI